ncbi:DUF1266 domain-containing protein [Enterococcus sp. AZ196]|uniref:DUF1266 domain-containing protein n=1 Tax=Enterococcus sp. AZ196 TaxID=2774659 RepID=UPI003D275A61
MGLLQWIKDTYMEGYNEAKAEQEEKDAQSLSEQEKFKENVSSIPLEKRLLISVAAPFRVVTFGDWFTLFKETEEKDEYLPIHLHTFGEGLVLSEEQKKRLLESLNKDFQVVDRDSALRSLEEMTETNWNYFDELMDDAQLTRVDYFQQPEVGALYAVLIAVSGYMLTASVDVGFLSESEALQAMEELLKDFPIIFTDWADYRNHFLAGNQQTHLNKGISQKALKKYTSYLLTKSGSPWQWLSLQEIRGMQME